MTMIIREFRYLGKLKNEEKTKQIDDTKTLDGRKHRKFITHQNHNR